MPFEADFTGTYVAVQPDSTRCGTGPWMHVVVDCIGESNVLGNFTTHFDFCADNEGNYPGSINKAYMVAESGDTLYISCAGQVIDGRMDDHPSHVVSYWRDPFEILGGTGKLEGAIGSGMTDDFNSANDQNSHHLWKGTITLSKKKASY
jgi:hypothetical protein